MIVSADKKDAEMQSQIMIVQSRVESYFFSFVALVFFGLDWTLAGSRIWAGCWSGASCWSWAGCWSGGRLLELGRLLEWGQLLEWGRLLEWGQLLGLGCLVKLGYSLKCPPLERQSALVKAKVSLLPHLIPVLGTNRC